MKNVSDESCRENRNTLFKINKPFSLEAIAIYIRQHGKILYNRTRHTWQYGAGRLHAG
jgi:cytochrome c biogenesis protein ResB